MNIPTDTEQAQACADAFKPLADAAKEVLAKSIDDGGPAFPGKTEYSYSGGAGFDYHGGMSLRDYLAGQAIIGLLSFPGSRDGCPAASFAEAAYKQADAMLKARTR